MALRDKIRTNITPHLQPGEQIQQVFAGQTKTGWFAMFGLIGLLIARPKIRTIAVTDRRIAVFSSSMWSVTKAIALVAEGPRTHLGQPNGLWWKCTALPETLYINKRFHKDVEQANAQA